MAQVQQVLDDNDYNIDDYNDNDDDDDDGDDDDDDGGGRLLTLVLLCSHRVESKETEMVITNAKCLLLSIDFYQGSICLPCQTVRQFLRLNNISVLEFCFLSSPIFFCLFFFITATTLIINRLMSAEYSLKNC
uniref:Uncharacterized protein n=1 Tax=Glossina pallidipes TaxID=7398 RepID=A0A1A9ZIQ1_GLOPL